MKNQEIKSRLEAAGLRTTGVYFEMPQIVADAIETVKLFGFEKWEKETSLGKKARDIVKEMAGA